MKSSIKSTTVDEYILSQPKDLATKLASIRKIMKKEAPDAVELILYGMPAYKTFGKPLIYFAAFKNHIGFYATPSGHSVFAKELSKYKQGKGSVQFPNDEPLPLDLIKRIVQYRVKENTQKNKIKK